MVLTGHLLNVWRDFIKGDITADKANAFLWFGYSPHNSCLYVDTKDGFSLFHLGGGGGGGGCGQIMGGVHTP